MLAAALSTSTSSGDNFLRRATCLTAAEADEVVVLSTPVIIAREVNGRDGPEPTRYGDWELRGRCIDF